MFPLVSLFYMKRLISFIFLLFYKTTYSDFAFYKVICIIIKNFGHFIKRKILRPRHISPRPDPEKWRP